MTIRESLEQLNASERKNAESIREYTNLPCADNDAHYNLSQLQRVLDILRLDCNALEIYIEGLRKVLDNK